jgi:hypothetical protein
MSRLRAKSSDWDPTSSLIGKTVSIAAVATLILVGALLSRGVGVSDGLAPRESFTVRTEKCDQNWEEYFKCYPLEENTMMDDIRKKNPKWPSAGRIEIPLT